MFSTLAVTILIYNLAVNEGSFVYLINDENDQLKPAEPETTIEELTTVKEVTFNETTTRTLSVTNDSALPIVEETFPNTVKFTNFTTEKGTLGAQCEDVTGCEDSLFCIHNTCQCAGEDFWKEDACVHVTKYTINSKCRNSFECSGKLLCLDGICQCSEEFIWNGTNCITKKIFGMQCYSQKECQDDLFCVAGICSCPDTYYLDKNKCVRRKDAKQECSKTEECQPSLSCFRQLCQCPSSDFWNGSICTLRKTFNSTCNSYPECKESLECKEDICQCRETDYWDGSYCVIKKSPGMTCSEQFECRNELHCLDDLCNCPDTEFLEEFKCLPKKVENSVCQTTAECKDTMKCRHGKCKCTDLEYWDSDFEQCFLKKELGGVCSSSIECQENLECDDDDTCVCKSSTYWNGMNCAKKLPSECEDIDSDKDGVYSVYPKGKSYSRRISVYCIMMGEKKWTVIQRRYDGSVDFYRTLPEYTKGFGRVDKEHWLGLENIYRISKDGSHELSVVLEDWGGFKREANYSTFYIGSGSSYSSGIGGYSGNAGNSLGYQSGYTFYTYDRDYNYCANKNTGAWWYRTSGQCCLSNLNGKYNGTGQTGIVWSSFRNYYSLKASTMMIRRK
ncbi:Angiopoietin-related protein 6,Angiopoietin-related protein 2,Microfibril-associated glycoprotein 4,Angiopoietin-related protein 1,Fibrinogen C domain-containing protein 1 [Mytilus coruscus]|uniref:Angiopoietin-related protein 6,Angiopoietin-related protein 2,Microfibril-associated glycoprotein 4,Angiopoietin-related protein 1,Fibrinogen C domain-containing protein 1 n=1 Tax=Mytilus coruscus TaxID=42192 RepID=A0A6J8BL63_MYTCO|nr:Angiopoietin-related protein 6,Angiopoietin-related protein 2,Microfibril-associated glycoprotein 4,Angiopoietin-related protein 1,Fibrinogen C domain-containing protein 1 [Mytilus coruscus]